MSSEVKKTNSKSTKPLAVDTEAALRKSEKKYRDLVETSNDLIWSVDSEGRWTFLNQKATRQIYGYEPEEMLGRPFKDFTASDKIDFDLQAFANVKAGRPVFLHETTHIRKDGLPVHLSFNAIVRTDGEGNVLGATGTATDITEQKKMLEQSRDRARQVIYYQTAFLGLMKGGFKDRKSNIQRLAELDAQRLQVERVGIWFFDSTRTQLICENLYHLHSNTHESGIALDAKQYPHYFAALEESRTIAADNAFEDPRTGEFASNYLKENNICSMLDVPIWMQGEVVGVVCHENVGETRKWTAEEQEFVVSIADMVSLAREAVRRRKAEAALKQRKEQLEQSNRDLEQFAYIASHDLQEPLYLIAAFSDRLFQHSQNMLDNKGKDYLMRIMRSAHRMRALIDSLLNLSRVSGSKIHLRPVSLDELIHDLLTDLALRVKELKAEIHIDPLGMVLGSRWHLRELFLNLISNALKFRKPGVPPRVHVWAHSLNNQLEIVVEDNGIGFETQYTEQIFKPFGRLQGQGDYEGTGMGLAICEKIVKRHGGEIEASSELGRGSTFKVRLTHANV